MDKDSISENFNTLKEMILDEKKLVTYVSLSKEMCIHVNDSKFLLNQIVEDLKNKKDTDILLNVNYIISGLLDSNKAQTSVCNATDLEATRTKFKTVFYQHIYSVSVGSPSTDNVSFMAINKFEDFPLCTGLIRSNSCIKRSCNEIGSLKTSSQDIVIPEQKPILSAQKKVKEESKNVKNGFGKPTEKSKDSKTEPVIKTEVISPKKEPTNNITQKTDRKNVKSQKGIAGFFNKPASKSVQKSNGAKESITMKNSKQEITEKTDLTKVKSEKMDIDENIPDKIVPETSTEQNVKKDNKSVRQNGNKSISQKDQVGKNENKSLSEIKKSGKLDKKRKRVLHVSDSESEDDPFTEEAAVDQESEDEIPPTPLVNTVKITSGIMNPKKRRKVVDKTYTDEDGYILTKKEEIYESCSENEEEVHIKENIKQTNKVKVEVSPPEKKNAVKNVKKKIASPQKGKQATLMSFFKKA